MKFQKPGLIGRKEEMKTLNIALSQAAQGHGSTIILSGEAGIGKSRLLQEFKAQASDFSIYSGAAAQDAIEPFMLFSTALKHEIETPLFSGEEHKSFTTVFAVNHAGLLVAQASTEDEELDGDIFAGMLTAVQSFVHDSVGQGGSQAGLGRLEYGDLKIIIEHSQHIFVTAVFSGKEHADMKKTVKQTVTFIESEHADVLKSWNGSMDEVLPISQLISKLAETKFLVRKDLEGMKLEEERLKIADRVLELISALASSKPALLVLEDLHWADESSLSVLEYLSRNILNQKVMILATSRPAEGGFLHEALGNIMGQGGTIMPLIGLEKKGLGDMMDEIYPGHSFPAEFTHDIIQQCDGNPFFFLELLRQIWVDGNVIEENGSFSLVKQNIAVPASVEDMILLRLAGLDSQAMSLAEYSSCIGKTFKREEAMSIESVRAPETAIKKLIDRGIILSNNGTVEFSHAIFQDVIYSGITGRWKAAYHKHLGEYYELAFEEQPSEVIYQLARHFFRSREHDKAFKYCIGAGEKAESAFAAEQALNFYNDAYSLTSKLRDSSQIADAEKFLPVRLGDLLNFTGQLDNALENYELALPRENDARKKASIFRKIAEVNHRRGEYEKSRNASESGLEILNGQICVEAERIYSILGWTFIRTGKHSKALELLDKGLEIATKCNDKEGIASVEHNLGSVMLHKGEYEKAITHFDKALAIREEINDVWHISSSLNNLGNSYMGLGDLLKSLEYYEKSVENSKNIGDNRARSISLNNMGNVHACLGDLNKSMDYYVQSYELKVKFDDKWGISTTLENIGTIHFTLGEMDKAQEHYQESMAIREKINDVAGIALSHINIGEAYHYTDEPAKAYEHYTQSLEIATEIDEKWLVIVSNYRIAETLLALGKIKEAHKYVDLALKTSIETSSKSEEARSRQALGNIHKVEGNYKLAIAEFDIAKKIYDETLEMGEQAKILYDFALLHLEMGETETAKQELKQALKLFNEAGGTFFAGKCQKKLDEIN